MDAMETTFNLKDVIYIVAGVASALGFYWKMIVKDKELTQKIEQLEKDVEKNESTMFKKFTNVHTRMDKNEEKNRGEFDSINKNLAGLESSIASINGKLDIIISKIK